MEGTRARARQNTQRVPALALFFFSCCVPGEFMHACMQGLKLFLDYSGTTGRRKAVATPRGAMAVGMSSRDAWAAAYSGVAAGAALVTGIGVMAYLRRSA